MIFRILVTYDDVYGMLEPKVYAAPKEFKNFQRALEAARHMFYDSTFNYFQLDPDDNYAMFKVENRRRWQGMTFELEQFKQKPKMLPITTSYLPQRKDDLIL